MFLLILGLLLIRFVVDIYIYIYWVPFQGPNIVIHQPKDVMDGMNDWCQEHHGQVQVYHYLTSFLMLEELTISKHILWLQHTMIHVCVKVLDLKI